MLFSQKKFKNYSNYIKIYRLLVTTIVSIVCLLINKISSYSKSQHFKCDTNEIKNVIAIDYEIAGHALIPGWLLD